MVENYFCTRPDKIGAVYQLITVNIPREGIYISIIHFYLRWGQHVAAPKQYIKHCPPVDQNDRPLIANLLTAVNVYDNGQKIIFDEFVESKWRSLSLKKKAMKTYSHSIFIIS